MSASDNRSTDAISLRNLRRSDEHITNILSTATAVGVYQFSRNPRQWNKMDIEGPLHVVRRSVNPTTMMIVTNRLNTKNLIEKITPGTDVSVQTPFLMIKSSQGVIYCIWFYSENECQETAQMIKQELERIKGGKMTPGKQQSENIAFSPSSPATASLVDTLVQIGVKNITVAKSVGGITPVSTPQSTKGTPPHSSFTENGGRSVDLNDLFAQASISERTNSNNRSGQPATRNNNLAPVNLLRSLEKVESNPESLDDEMLTPSMIKEKSRQELQKNDSLNTHNSTPLSVNNHRTVRKANTSSRQETKSPSQNNNHLATDISIDQLKLTLIHLIQTDADFVLKIRNALLSKDF